MEITVNLSIILQLGEFQSAETRFMDKFTAIFVRVHKFKAVS